jgi:hypothetical protein
VAHNHTVKLDLVTTNTHKLAVAQLLTVASWQSIMLWRRRIATWQVALFYLASAAIHRQRDTITLCAACL